MNKYLLVGAIVLVALLGGYFMYRGNPADNNAKSGSATDQNQKSDQVQNEPEAKPAFTLAQIAEHATSTDCWLAIEGKVYDITKQIAGGTHPGGEANVQGCGKDATELFNTRPMGSGTPHSDKARSFLPNFYIGELATE